MRHYVNKEKGTKVCPMCLIDKSVSKDYYFRPDGRTIAYCKTCTPKRKPPLISVWCNIKKRCYLKNSQYYYCYGGRGIKMCSQWRYSYKAFETWCLKNGWKKGLTLDRINNDKGYAPSNCRFVTNKQNVRNRSVNVNVTFNGETKTIGEWAEITGISPQTMYSRHKFGWPSEAILSKTPIRNGNRKSF